MDVRQLRYFEAVARHRHFTRAAQELHVAQSALSHQVRSLERELGVELLRRTTRSVEPTEAGALVEVRARAVLAETEALRGEVEELRGLVRGHLGVGAMLFGVPSSRPVQKPEAPVLDLIFVGGRDAAALAERYPRHPFLVILPELALCHLKVRNSADNLRSDWLQKLSERERELRDLLPGRGEEDRDLEKMLDRNDRLTARQINTQIDDFLVAGRAALRIDDAGRWNGIVTAPNNRTYDETKQVPTLVMRNDDYGRIARTLADAARHSRTRRKCASPPICANAGVRSGRTRAAGTGHPVPNARANTRETGNVSAGAARNDAADSPLTS